MTPATDILNYDWSNHVGSVEIGKFADLIAVSGDPLADTSRLPLRTAALVAPI